MKRTVHCIAAVFAAVCAMIFGQCIRISRILPNEITAYYNENISFRNFTTIGVNNQFQNIKDLKKAASVSAGDTSYECSVSLFNIIPTKTVTVRQTNKKYAVPCGTLFGIKFYARGAAVIRCCDISLGDTTVNPGKNCGLIPGDAIVAIDGCEIESYRDVERLTMQSGGDKLHLTCLRGEKQFETDIVPAAADGGYRLGLWIKDSAAGLGTMTFYDPETGAFASLGHGICDDETSELLAIEKAEITRVEIAGITKSSSGNPGSINGYFDDDPPIGTATVNNGCGLFGSLQYIPTSQQPVEIANIQDIYKGKAQILCTLDNGAPKLYDIEITGIDYDEKNKTKNLQILATDERLLSRTGGIVQGMSGSPILQNGKLVGAVTHVLLTNSAKGYGIFAQNMFDEMEKAQN